MKKIILFIVLFSAHSLIFAQLTSLSEGFETLPFPSNGWDGDFGASPLWGRTNASPHSGSFCAEVGMGVFDPIEAILETPQINISSSTVKNLSFWRKSTYEALGNADSTYVQISTNSGSSWITLKILKADAQNDNIWVKEVIDLSSYANQTFSIRWKYVGEGMEAWQMYIDDINIGSVAPGNLMIASALNQAKADLSWQHPGADSYKIYRSTDNNTYSNIGTSLSSTYTDNTINLNTRYYYKVSAVYNSNETGFSSSATVKVPGGISVWTDDFESGTINNAYTLIDGDGALSFDTMNYDDLSSAWLAYAWKIRSSQFTTHYACHSGIYSIGSAYNQNASAKNDWIILPQISVSDTTFRFGFYATSQDPAYKETLEVLVSTTNTNTSSFSPINTISQVPGRPNWGEYEYSLKNYSGQNIYLAIKCSSTDKFIAIVDDIYVFRDQATTTNALVLHDSDFLIYPNPASSILNFKFTNNRINTIEIFDINGQEIDSFMVEGNEIKYAKKLNKGVYLVRAKSGNDYIQKKLVVL